MQLAFTLKDPGLIGKAEAWVNAVLAHQEQDGYIGSYLPTDDRMEDYNAWGTNWALRALFSYYEATGREDVLRACHRGLLWFVDNWKDHRTNYAGSTLIEGMIVGYTLTGDTRLLQFAEDYMAWLEENSPWPNYTSAFRSDRFDYNSIHTVAYGEEVKHPALLYAVNGNEDDLRASVNGIEKILAKGTQRTGAPVSNCEFLSPPGATHETEYCNFATYSNTYQWLSMITGDPHYGDLTEKIVFNGAEGARKKDERAIAYMTSPNQIYATMNSGLFLHSSMQAYAPVYHVACCPAQSVRVLPEYVRSMCMTDREGGLYLTAYGPCSIDAGTMKIQEQTDYPFDGKIRLAIILETPQRQMLYLRIPGWCRRATVSVNGGAADVYTNPKSYVKLDRLWQDGDTVELLFEMKIHIVQVQCQDTPTAPLLAVERGPLLFSHPIREVWTKTAGTPLTPLPEDWSWFEVRPDLGGGLSNVELHQRYDRSSWNLVVDGDLLKDGALQAVYMPAEDYPWEKPRVVIRIPARKARYAYPLYPEKTMNPYHNPMPADGCETQLELVPYGCTALRISYFTTGQKT